MPITSTLRRLALSATLTSTALLVPAAQAQFSLSISVRTAPPPLPVYVQPPCPSPNFLWTPGFWAWSDVSGYYWVPGTWVAAPSPGLLWTPGYWGFGGGGYFWHSGYWGPHVGFYGGINYGFGYGGVGFVGGAWRGGAFAYNTAVVNVNRTNITNVYVDRTVVHNTTIINNNVHTSFNGGQGGIQARPTQEQQAFAREPHTAPTQIQQSHLQNASMNRENFNSVNHGMPARAAVAEPRAAMGGGNGVGRPGNEGPRGNGFANNDNRGNFNGQPNQPRPQQNPGAGRGDFRQGNNGNFNRPQPQQRPNGEERGRPADRGDRRH